MCQKAPVLSTNILTVQYEYIPPCSLFTTPFYFCLNSYYFPSFSLFFFPLGYHLVYLTVFSLLFRSPSAYFYYIPLWHNSHLPALLSYSLESLPLCHSYPTICLSFPSVLTTPYSLPPLPLVFPFSLFPTYILVY